MSVTQVYKTVNLSYRSVDAVVAAMQTAQNYYLESHGLCARTPYDDFWTSRLAKLHDAFRELGREDLILMVLP